MKKSCIFILSIGLVFCMTSLSFAKEKKYATHLYNTYNKIYYNELTKKPEWQLTPQFTHVSIPKKNAQIYDPSMKISKTHPVHQCESLAARMIDEHLVYVCVENKK